MPMVFEPPRVLVFDVGGTVFDWASAIIERLLEHTDPARQDPGALSTVAFDCRGAFLSLQAEVIRGERRWMGADDVYSEALAASLEREGIGLPVQARASLRHAWRRMPAWPGAADAISTLRQRCVVAPLTVLSLPMVPGSSRAAGIDWDCVLSCDLLGVYKPDPRCFARATDLLAVAPSEVMMVASHPSDLRGAASAGWRTAYIRARLFDPGDDYQDRGFQQEFDLVAEDFPALVRALAT